MSPVAAAMARASRGLDWSYPCLVWIADYLVDATGRDPAEGWRQTEWDEASAKASLARLAVHGEGETAVERALDFIARRDGWESADGPRQGAVMVGCYTAADGIGVPAIFDGDRRWIISNDGRGWTALSAQPPRMWEISR